MHILHKLDRAVTAKLVVYTNKRYCWNLNNATINFIKNILDKYCNEFDSEDFINKELSKSLYWSQHHCTVYSYAGRIINILLNRFINEKDFDITSTNGVTIAALQLQELDNKVYSDYYEFIDVNQINFFVTDHRYWKFWFEKIEHANFNDDKKRKKISITDDCNKPISRTFTTSDYVKVMKLNRYRDRFWKYQDFLSYPHNLYPNEVSSWLYSEINKMKKEINDPCLDNVRFASIKSSSQMKRYNRLKNAGCCGFRDKLITHEIYGSFMIGCNYGH